MEYTIHTNAIDKFYKKLDEVSNNLEENNKIVIFGTNKISGMMAHYLENKGLVIHGLIDNDSSRHGKKIFGIGVYSPEDLLKEFDDNYRILIVSGHQKSMVEQLETMGYIYDKNIIVVIDLNKEMNDYSYVDRSNCIELTDKEIKERQVKALKHLKKVCDANNIKYYLAYGTLLGAVRHKGFIPWDDDVDVFVELEDLKKLNEVMKNDKEYSLISFVDENSDYCDEISLFVDNSAIMDNNHFPIQLSTGITMDVFYLSGIPDDEEEMMEYALKAKELEQIKWNKYYSKEECKKAVKDVLDFLSKYKFGETKRVGSVLSPYFLREIFDYESFANPIELQFEDVTLKCPSDYDSYLKQIYGEDYMTPPPEDKRGGHHSYKIYKK